MRVLGDVFGHAFEEDPPIFFFISVLPKSTMGGQISCEQVKLQHKNDMLKLQVEVKQQIDDMNKKHTQVITAKDNIIKGKNEYIATSRGNYEGAEAPSEFLKCDDLQVTCASPQKL